MACELPEILPAANNSKKKKTKEEIERDRLNAEVSSFDEDKWKELLKNVEILPEGIASYIYQDLDHLDKYLKLYYDKLFDPLDNELQDDESRDDGILQGHENTIKKIDFLLPKIWKFYGIVYYITLYLLSLQRFLKDPVGCQNVDNYKKYIKEYLGNDIQKLLVETPFFAGAVSGLFLLILHIRFQADLAREKEIVRVQRREKPLIERFKLLFNREKIVPKKLKLLFDLFYCKNKGDIVENEYFAVFSCCVDHMIFCMQDPDVNIFDVDDVDIDEKEKLDIINRLANIKKLVCISFPKSMYKALYPDASVPRSRYDESGIYLSDNRDFVHEARKMIAAIIGRDISHLIKPKSDVVQNDEFDLSLCGCVGEIIKQNKLYAAYTALACSTVIAYSVITFVAGIALIASPIVVSAVLASIGLSWLLYTICKAIKGDFNVGNISVVADEQESNELINIDLESTDESTEKVRVYRQNDFELSETPFFDPNTHEDLPGKLFEKHFEEKRNGKRSTLTGVLFTPRSGKRKIEGMKKLIKQYGELDEESCDDKKLEAERKERNNKVIENRTRKALNFSLFDATMVEFQQVLDSRDRDASHADVSGVHAAGLEAKCDSDNEFAKHLNTERRRLSSVFFKSKLKKQESTVRFALPTVSDSESSDSESSGGPPLVNSW